MAAAVGQKVWAQAPGSEQWVGAIVSSVQENGQLELKLEPTGQQLQLTVSDEAPLCLQNEEEVEDMTELTFLHEPGVLANLQRRYSLASIYTYTGSILIAVNPFQPLPDLYSRAVMDAYAGGASEGRPPHVYAIASAAYRKMRSEGKGQAILVTGESGAGKTETSKLIMRYLAYLGGFKQSSANLAGEAEAADAAAAAAAGGATSIEQKVLESNPLLEAFGNAKTVRNDNSSRFGKYVEINFNGRGAISGASIRTYLLERSRLVHQNPGERNYHIFYQLCAGATPEERARWLLAEPSAFACLNQTGVYTLPGVSDATEFGHTRHAMASIGISLAQQEEVFRVLAAILHLGNIAWHDGHSDGGGPAGGGDNSSLCNGTAEAAAAAAAAGGCPLAPGAASAAALAAAAKLMGCEAGALARALSTRTRATPDGPITSPLDAPGSCSARDALVKVLYARLFDWLVGRINASIGHDDAASASIGLLDIYGFESFAFNDLEQFCINLANEKLQQHFNAHVFKWEQAEYEAEGIDWSYINFVDNQDVLDLIEGRLGMIDLLDEQCRFPTATSRDLGDKLLGSPAVSGSSRFSRTKRSTSAFTLSHYAGPVSYSLDNFLDKNKDYVIAEHASLLGGADCGLLARELFGSEAAAAAAEPQQQNGRTPSGAGGGLGGRSLKAFQFVSVCSHFKRQLAELMALLHALEPHYVRCIKPNPCSKPLLLDEPYALHQLKCGGVMEAVRISCAGYPFRRTFADFLAAYCQLYPKGRHAAQGGPQAGADACRALLAVCGLQEGADYQVGATKVFLKAHQAATLARLHTAALSAAATAIQAHWRGGAARQHYKAVRAAIIVLQAGARGMAARRLAERLRRDKAATALQAAWRSRTARLEYAAQQEAALVLQALLRGAAARTLYAAMLAAHRAAAATKLQAAWRGSTAAKAFRQQQAAARVLQCSWRAAAARQQRSALQARSAAAATIQKAWRRHKQPAGWAAYGGYDAADAAAGTIQRIWRERAQHNSKVRHLRAAVVQYVALHGATVVLQRAWRCRSAAAALSKVQETKRRSAFKAQMTMFEGRSTQAAGGVASPTAAGTQQQQQQQQQQQMQRRFLSDTDSSPASPPAWHFGGGFAPAAPHMMGAAPRQPPQHVQGRLPPAQRAAFGVSFEGLPPPPGQQQQQRQQRAATMPGSPSAAAAAAHEQGGTSPRARGPSPSGARSSWVLPPPPPAGYGIGFQGINGDRHPLQPGRALAGGGGDDSSSSGAAAAGPHASRSNKLFAPPPPAAYGASFVGLPPPPGQQQQQRPAHSASESGATCMRARLLEPAPPAAYGVAYGGIQGSSSNNSSYSRPKLWQTAGGGSKSFSGGSPKQRRGKGGDDDAAPLLSCDGGEGRSNSSSGEYCDIIKADDSPFLSPEERLSARLGGLWQQQGKVSGLLSSFKQRLSAQG